MYTMFEVLEGYGGKIIFWVACAELARACK